MSNREDYSYFNPISDARKPSRTYLRNYSRPMEPVEIRPVDSFWQQMLKALPYINRLFSLDSPNLSYLAPTTLDELTMAIANGTIPKCFDSIESLEEFLFEKFSQ